MKTQFTNSAGHRFYVERALDFSADGGMKAGRGWFAGLIVGNDHLGGVWFDTREAAMAAAHQYEAA